jgi:hypothetical protein
MMAAEWNCKSVTVTQSQSADLIDRNEHSRDPLSTSVAGQLLLTAVGGARRALRRQSFGDRLGDRSSTVTVWNTVS